MVCTPWEPAVDLHTLMNLPALHAVVMSSAHPPGDSLTGMVIA
jgi:hypothetical protein